ncbi:MAG: hypothetical protein GX271_00510 [Clostridiales bacterium]|nr:hypothetical protein [Clostridiales bacterium]
MMNINGRIDMGSQYSSGLVYTGLSDSYTMRNAAFEQCLDGLDDETIKEVRKHMDDFRTVEEMEMFIKQKTKGRNYS